MKFHSKAPMIKYRQHSLNSFCFISLASDFDSINKTNAIKLMTEQPTLIKRPVIEHNDNVIVGFSEDTYQQTF